jgi:type VI secretion system protein ImpL
VKRYLAIFKKRWFWQLFGLLVLGLLIWFVGPMISIGSWSPLAGLWTRIVVIAVLLLILLGTWAWRRWRANKAAKGIEEGLGALQEEAPVDASAEELSILQERFNQALELLKKTRKGKRDFSERWLYELPWYLIIGPPGCGKTTLLANSDLEFPLEGEFGKQPVAGVGGTRNCDWTFTNDAILLDTAGRYTTQDSHQETDKGAWEGFLDLLKKFRPRRPINGVLVAMSLQDLIQQSEAERRDQAMAIRSRIIELSDRLKVRFPVYLLITKCDLVAGFVEFFEDMGKEERAQVWGFTFQLADASAGVDVTERAIEEIDLLIERMNDQVCERMNKERSLSRRTRIFGFPQQMASLRGTIGDFIRLAFKPNRFQPPPLLRGVYFTSGTQEGTPVDRLMRDLADSYGLDRAAPASAGGSTGRSYFINRLFRRIIFPEANLVGTDPRTERRRRWLRRGAFASITLFSVALVLGWMWSFSQNQTAARDVHNNAQNFAKEIADQDMSSTDFRALLGPLNELKTAADRFPSDPPLSMRLGLYQGPRVAPTAEDAYKRVLRTRLLAAVGERLRDLVRVDSPPAELARRLKAYLMLGQPQRLEGDHLRAVMYDDWGQQFINDLEIADQLDGHLARMIEAGYEPLPMDEGLIRDARDRLAQVEQWQVIYGQIQAKAAEDSRNDYELRDLIGRNGDIVFTSSQGDLDTHVVPVLYTLNGYTGIFLPESKRLIQQVSKDAWVYGIPDDEQTQHEADLVEEVSNRYASDYIETWRNVLDGLSVRQAGDIYQLVELVDEASGPTSPLREVLTKVAKETRPGTVGSKRLAAGDAAEAAEAAGSAIEVAAQMNTRVQVARQRVLKLKRAADKAGIETDLFGGRQNSVMMRVDTRFRDIQELAEKPREDEPSDLDQLLLDLTELYDFLRKFTAAGSPDDAARSKLQELLQGAGSPSEALLRQADDLPNPLRAWVLALSNGGAQAFGKLAQKGLEERWQDEIVDYCQTAIEGRYPIERGASREVKLADFARFFGPGGKLDSFFDEHLRALVDTSTSPWTWRRVTGADLTANQESLVQLERAGRIRAAFFSGGGNTPSVEMTVTPIFLDATSGKVWLTMDGQLLEYAHTEPRPARMTWPGPKDAGYAVIEFLDLDGITTSLRTTGDWAWFRLLDLSQRRSSGDKTTATFSKGGHRVSFEIQAGSVFNPLQMSSDINQFKCVPNL